MDTKDKKISKVSRILSIYHLFRYCKEVSYKEITDLMPVGRKTIERDIALLKAAGLLNIHFSKCLHAFVPAEGEEHMACRLPPVFPESKAQRKSIEKIIRLTEMMVEMDGAENPTEWYRAQYPALSPRTMQRDFAELNAIGYYVRYQDSDDGFDDHPAGSHYCDYPYNTYGLKTFERML